jgi:hypothetical protein
VLALAMERMSEKSEQQVVMVIVVADKVHVGFYRVENLKDHTHSGEDDI